MPTGISYVDETWNPVVGCSKISSGCKFCYAEKMAYRLACMGQKKYREVVSTDGGVWNGKVFCDEKALDIPLHWRKPRRILVPSMGDWLHPKVPFEFRADMLSIAAVCKQHTFLFLTKRAKELPSIEKMREHIAKRILEWDIGYAVIDPRTEAGWPIPNIHLGVTVCNQKEADEKIPILLQIPAAHRWISIEPMLGKIEAKLWQPQMEKLAAFAASRPISHIENPTPEIKRVVVGCESGPKRRPCKLEWIRSIVQQCKAAGVGCYVKQVEINGKVEHDIEKFPEWAQVRETI